MRVEQITWHVTRPDQRQYNEVQTMAFISNRGFFLLYVFCLHLYNKLHMYECPFSDGPNKYYRVFFFISFISLSLSLPDHSIEVCETVQVGKYHNRLFKTAKPSEQNRVEKTSTKNNAFSTSCAHRVCF